MRILYLITTPDHGGAQVNLLDLVSGWPNGIECIVATGAEGFLTESARNLGVEVVILPNLVRELSPLRDIRAYREISALIRDRAPDLVHCHSSKAGMLGRLAAGGAGVPSVFTVHGWAFEEGISRMRRFVGRVAEFLTARLCQNQHVITVAEADRQLAIEINVIDSGRMTTIHNGIKDDLRLADPAFPGVATIVTVARFSEQKDHESLLRALAEVAEPGFDWFAVLVMTHEGQHDLRLVELVLDLDLFDGRFRRRGPRRVRLCGDVAAVHPETFQLRG